MGVPVLVALVVLAHPDHGCPSASGLSGAGPPGPWVPRCFLPVKKFIAAAKFMVYSDS